MSSTTTMRNSKYLKKGVHHGLVYWMFTYIFLVHHNKCVSILCKCTCHQAPRLTQTSQTHYTNPQKPSDSHAIEQELRLTAGQREGSSGCGFSGCGRCGEVAWLAGVHLPCWLHPWAVALCGWARYTLPGLKSNYGDPPSV